LLCLLSIIINYKAIVCRFSLTNHDELFFVCECSVQVADMYRMQAVVNRSDKKAGAEEEEEEEI